VSNLSKRLASAAVLLPVVITAFILGGWWLKGMVLLAAVAGFFEYGKVVAQEDKLARALFLCSGLAVTVIGLTTANLILALLSMQLAFLVLASLTVLRPGPDLVLAFRKLATLVFGILWTVPGFVSVCRLRDLGDHLGPAHHSFAAGSFILVAFVATWANDTCAYFAGRFLGKRKMAPTISPKKTWEGFFGGALGTLAFLLVGRALFPIVFSPMTALDMIVITGPVAFLGPMGDLCESLWKRAHDVKDSGNLIPGHGGMLDRVDAVFFVAPWVLGYFVAIKPILDSFVAGG
jgi:phosphatidate cytidylyltransferase